MKPADRLQSTSIVVPVYNAERSLRPLVERIVASLRGRYCDLEIILVNDGSRDASWPLIETLVEEFPEVIGIDLMKNSGQQAALLVGLRRARMDCAVTIDDDLQHSPECIPTLIERLEQGYDVVYGVPKREVQSAGRNISSVVTKQILEKIMNVDRAAQASAFRAVRKEVIASFRDYEDPFVDIDALLSWGTDRFDAVIVPYNVRQFGVSNYSLAKLIRYTINNLTSFSAIPLRIASIVGFFFTLVGAATLAYVFVVYFIQSQNVPGFAFLVSIISLFAGAQLFALGIMGEYMAKMHFRIMGKHSGIIRRVRTAQKSASTVPKEESGVVP
jgi:glycosyltransferase involved in cell wall biosynthesis